MNKYLKIGLLTSLGALAGFLYYHFWGCTNGCPLQSNWLLMTAYGALAGFVLSLPAKKKERKDNGRVED